MSSYDTGTIFDMVTRCEDLASFKSEILSILQDQRDAWQVKINQILQEKGYTSRKMAQLCQVSETAVRKWRNGALPQRREMYIRIGFAAEYDLDQMNAFLQRYGKCPQLYVKSLEDSICMYVLRSSTLPHTYETCQKLLGAVREELQKTIGNGNSVCSTTQLSEYFFSITSREEMVDFIKQNAPSYRAAYERLYNYIQAYLRYNLIDGQQEQASFHSMATESRWSSSLRHCISEIRNKRWFPLRHKVISLGLHLNMDVDGINDMLRLAQMEDLCAKNPVEATVIYGVEEAKLNDLIFCNGSNDLCQYVKNIFRQLELADSEFLIDDL